MLILTSLALALPPVDDPVRAQRHASSDAAVVIGIEDYAFLPDVPFAERDAFAVADTLKLSVGIDRNNVAVLTQNPSREQIVRALREAGEQAGPQGTVWVYFAGHGAADPASGERVLLGVDAQADRDTLVARGLTLTDLKSVATSSGSEAFVILDACFTGTSRDGSDLVPGARMVVPTAWSEPPGVTVWSATEPSQWASPLQEAEHGAFTYAMLGAMRGWADGYVDGTADGTVTAQEADAYIERTLRDLGVRNQQPTLVGTDRVLVRGDSLEPAPDFDATPAPVATNTPSSAGWATRPQTGPSTRPPKTTAARRRDLRVIGAGGGMAAVGLITVVASYASGVGDPDIDPAKLSRLKTVNAVGWTMLATGGTVSAVALAVPTRHGVAVGVSGRF